MKLIKRIKQIGITTKYTLAVCLVLLVLNIVLGILIMNQSGKAMRNLIRRHMLSTAETAASMIDGDELKGLTAEDVSSKNEVYHDIADTLLKIQNAQNDVDIKYIYLVKREGDHYIYTIDPDPEDPAEFGEEVVDTPGQNIAWSGSPAIDPEPVEDEWGCYYTAWCAIPDSGGATIGMVGIDFAADWYDQQMSKHTMTVTIVTCLSFVIIMLIMTLLTWQLHNRFRQLDGELSVLSGNVENLAQAVKEQSRNEESPHEETSTNDESDMIRMLCEKVHSTQVVLTDYMRYIEKQAFTDDMTGVANKDAYLNLVKVLNQQIKEGTAAFCVVVFDINGLKSANDNHGHEYGDRIIIDTARLISNVFGKEQVFRIGGDEFITIITREENNTVSDPCGIEQRLAALRESVERFNREQRSYETPLSFSMGSATFRKGEDHSFKEVFKRADMAMYKDKNDFYKNV